MNPSELRLVTGLGVLLFVAGCGSSASSQPSNEGSGGKVTASTGGTTAGNGGQSGGGTTSTGGTSGGATGGGDTSGGATGTGGSGPPPFDAGTDPNRNLVQPGDVCDRIATIQCAAEQTCCNAPGRSFDDCKTSQKKGCVDNFLDDVTTNPISGYTASTGQPVFTTFEGLASKCDITVTAWGASTTGLHALTPGTVSGNCTPTVDEFTSQPAIAAHLASCQGGTDCLPGQEVPVPKPWNCAAPSSAGGPCFTDVNCVDGLYCFNPNLAVTGATCRARKNVGESCSLGNECSTLLCKGGACADLNQQNAFCLAN